MAPFPLSFDVAESSSKVATSARRSELNSAAFQSVGASNEARAVQQLRRELSQTVALSSPQTVSESELRAALPTLTASVWRDIVQERQLTRKCGYPLCSNAPSREYSSSPQQLKFTSNGKIVDVRERAPFCSVNCLRRSKFIERSSIPTKSSQLWEDVEPESKDKKGSTVSPALTEGAPPSSPDLIAHLPIIERPLSQDTPRAPQPGQVDFEATRGPLRHAAPANATPRRFILNKRIRTQQSPLHTSATHATVDPSDPEPPDLDGLSLYDQAAVGSNGNRRGAAQDDMNDEERAIWMLGRDLRDQLRVEGELE